MQITVAEDIGIEHRGTFYEHAGVVRDIVQNHIMQLIGHVAMEPPVSFHPDYIRDEKIKVFHSMRVPTTDDIDAFMVRGQYGTGTIDGKKVKRYRGEEHVAPDSNTPTFIAAKFYIDNWRWAGVPFYIRTGKRMTRRVTEICIEFKQPPLHLFGKAGDVLEPNLLLLTVQPNESISLRFGIKYPQTANKIYPVMMDFSYQDTFRTKSHPAYERLLIDALKGDLTLFVRQDGVEAMWRLIDPITTRWENTAPPRFPNYRAGTWGPEQSDQLLQKEGRRWHTQ
jgi:glucose-6-phosphate 1-dehydrogenase